MFNQKKREREGEKKKKENTAFPELVIQTSSYLSPHL